MLKQFNIRRFIKRLLITAVVCVALFAALVVVGRHILKNNGISYQQLEFRFPASIVVEGLRVNNNALSIQAGVVSARWTWQELWRGNFHGKSIVIQDALIHIKPATGEADTTTSIPIIDIERALLKNVSVLWTSQDDSSDLHLDQVNAVGLRYDGALTLDSLITKGSRFAATYSQSQQSAATEKPSTGKAFSIESIPAFRVRHFEFEEFGAAIQYGKKRYAISDFNLQLSGLNNHDIMDMSLERLSFRYQDSLNVDVVLSAATMNRQNEAYFENLLFELPGLRISAPELTLSNNGGFGVTAKFDSSYLNTDLINFFFPALKKWIPANQVVVVDGGLGYRANRVVLDRTTVTIDNKEKISATGYMQFAGAGDSLNLNVAEIKTSLYTLAAWGLFEIPSGQRDLALHGRAKVTGTQSHLHSDGQMVVGQTLLHYETTIARRTQGTAIDVAVKSPSFEPKAIISALTNDFRVMGMSLKGSTLLANGTPKYVNVQLDGDSLFTGDRWIDAPSIAGSYSHRQSVASILFGPDKLAVTVSVVGDVLSGNPISCSGTVRFQLPTTEELSAINGNLYARFHGTVQPRRPAADIVFDTLQFNPWRQAAYTTKGLVSLERFPDKSFKALVSVDKYAEADVLLGEDFTDWLERDDKFSHFPTAMLSLSVRADTTLLKALVGTPAHINIEKLQLVSRPDDITVDFATDTLLWQDFFARRLQGNMHYYPGQLTAKIESPELITPFTILDSVKLEVVTDRDSAFTVSLNTYLPEIDRPLGLSYHVTSLRDSFRVSFADSTLLLGLHRWHTNEQGSLDISREFDAFSGELKIANGSQRAILQGAGKELLWKLEGLELFPIFQTISPEPAIRGTLNASASANFDEEIYRWNGELLDTSVDTIKFGDMKFNGSFSPDALSVSAELRDSAYAVAARLDKNKLAPAQFDVEVEDVDLSKFSSLLPVPPSTLTVNGFLNANVHGSYGDKILMTGYVSFPNTEIISSEYDVYLKSDKDSLVLEGTTARLHDFAFRDRQGNPLIIDGNVNLAEAAMDIRIKTDRFRLLDRTQKQSTLTGEIDLASDVRVRGRKGDYKVSGKIATLEGASLTYLYKSSVTLDDRQREMEFVSFTQQEVAQATRPRRKSTRDPLEWDVTFDVGKIDVTVLFSSVNQDHIKTTASGSVAFKTGTSAEPSAYGIIESASGNIAYHVPMISDLRMTIEKAGVRWVGEVAKPLLSFNGSQLFKISPNEISSLWTNKTDRWPISVIAKVNDRALNDLVLEFDISSTNNQVASWITTLAPDTRQAYAVSLLLRGRINTGGTADVNLLTQTMVSKMNEISSRNIKSADVSFYDESRGPNSSEGSTSKIGYSISKGLANKKMRIVVGGSVDLTGHADPSMPDVKVEYVLREDPTITLRAGKANVYTGVVDGNVDESSFGFTYIKRFRNLFKWHKNRVKE